MCLYRSGLLQKLVWQGWAVAEIKSRFEKETHVFQNTKRTHKNCVQLILSSERLYQIVEKLLHIPGNIHRQNSGVWLLKL